MNYYALFLNGDSIVEKCLSLIKYISNPNSKSAPHITVRVFNEFSDRIIEHIEKREITYLNFVEPGNFNINKNNPPFVVWIGCESEELEEVEHKPDYPFSRLHITLYEGNDISYAQGILSILNKEDWHLKLSFETPHKLEEQRIGVKSYVKHDFKQIYEEIVGRSFSEFLENKTNNQYRLHLVSLVFKIMYKELAKKTEKIDSYYLGKDTIESSEKYIDASDSLTDFQIKINTQDKKKLKKGIFITPPEYAQDMAESALKAFGDDSRVINFGDCAIGTGMLFKALKLLIDYLNKVKNMNYIIKSAKGIDIDKKNAQDAYSRYAKRELEVIHGDALLLSNIDLGPQRNLMLVNPPYNRYESIPKEYIANISKLAEEQTKIKVGANSGLFVYHLLIMDKWLCEGGVAVWLLPSYFLQTNYGEAVRQYLLYNVQLISLHVYDERKVQFQGVDISTVIVTFKKQKPDEKADIIVSYGESISVPSFLVKRATFREAFGNWRNVIVNNAKRYNQDAIMFRNLFDIKRGIATGANSFFVMERSEAKKHDIPDFALKPILPKARFLKSHIINAEEDGYPDVNPQLVLIDCELGEAEIKKEYPLFYNYLQLAKKKDDSGRAIVDRTLVRSRRPWYVQEKRKSSPFLLTYMGREKSDSPPLYFLWNRSKAVALNTYLMLYPKEWLLNLLNEDPTLYEQVFFALKKSAEMIISQQTRVYSGGLQKLEPGELKELPVIELPSKIVKEYDKIYGNNSY